MGNIFSRLSDEHLAIFFWDVHSYAATNWMELVTDWDDRRPPLSWGIAEGFPWRDRPLWNINCGPYMSIYLNTSSTAQGGGGSFKNRKPIGEVGCCESRMAERRHWWTDRWLELCFSPNSVLLGVLNAFLRCPPSAFPRSSLLLSPFLFPFVGWCVRLPEVLSPLVSDCVPSGFLLLHGVRLPEVLSPLVSLLVSFCWMVCPPRSCLPLSPLLLDGVSAFPRSCPLSRFLSHALSPLVFHCLQKVSHCIPLSPLVSHCFPLSPSPCVPVLDDVSSFPRSCLSLSPIVSPHVCLPCPILSLCLPLSLIASPTRVFCVGWCARLPKVLSPLSPSLSLFLFPFVAGGFSLLFPKLCTVRGSIMLS